MKRNQDRFIKINAPLKRKRTDVEMGKELDTITKLEISRIKTKAERKWLTKNHESKK